MGYALVSIYILAVLTMFCTLTGWIGCAVSSGYWWDSVRIDFPEYGGEYRKFSYLVLLNVALPAGFISLILLSLIFEKVFKLNLIPSLLSGFAYILMLSNVVANPLIIKWSTKDRCAWMYQQPKNNLSSNSIARFNQWIDDETKGFSDGQKNVFIKNLDEKRCYTDGQKFKKYYGVQILAVVLLFTMAPIYTCTV